MNKEYYGRILNGGNFSAQLKKELWEAISHYRDFDQKSPSSPYISAWHQKGSEIWYEFISKKITEIIGCSPEKTASFFWKNILERRRLSKINEALKEKSIFFPKMKDSRKLLREESEQTGLTDALYKVKINSKSFIWLKDQATVKKFRSDKIYLSFGNLTLITNEIKFNEMVEKMSYQDEATGLPRRAILPRMINENINAFYKNEKKAFSLILIDIDNFKAINDNHGHLSGDYIISAAAKIMLSAKNRNIKFGRYGGDEFFAIFEGNRLRAKRFVEKLRRKIKNKDFNFKGKKIKITISAGIASIEEIKKKNSDNIISLADNRLYQAKNNGRDRIKS